MQGINLWSIPAFMGLAQPGLSQGLNVTVVGASNGMSRFECWQMAAPFISSSQPGIVGTQTTHLGKVTNMTYNVIPAGFDSGLHTAPYNQWGVVLQGVAILTMESTDVSVVIQPGELGLLFFMDTADVSIKGHGTFYPGVTETVFLQIPTMDGEIPEHEVVYENSPCKATEFSALRGWAVPNV